MYHYCMHQHGMLECDSWESQDLNFFHSKKFLTAFNIIKEHSISPLAMFNTFNLSAFTLVLKGWKYTVCIKVLHS